MFVALFVAFAAIINHFNTLHFDVQYAYLCGSLLFTIPMVWFCISRKDIIRLMTICGIVGIPFGVLTEYFFYTRDWWLPQTITGTRIGIEDIVYSFFHGALLSTTGLVLLDKNITLDEGSYRSMTIGVLKIGLAIIVSGLVGVVIFKLPSFIVTTLIFAMVGAIMTFNRPDLIKVGLVGMCGTIGWCAPVFWITNSFFPGWIQHFWINNTNKILILQIPLPDLCWYASVGFSAAILPEALIGKKPTYTIGLGSEWL